MMTQNPGTPELMPFEPEEERYHITSDGEADRWIERIQDARAEHDRFVAACAERIAEFEARIKAADDECVKEVAFALGVLREYFDTVPHKTTKTQESYSLPSGKLVFKRPAIAPRIDEQTLFDWVKGNAPDYVQTTQKTKWGELKKLLSIVGEVAMITETGGIVEGVNVTDEPAAFSVKF